MIHSSNTTTSLSVTFIGAILSLLLWAAFSLLLGWPLMLLWNALMPVIFSLPAITFWQAVGLMLLTSLLFRWNVSLSERKTTTYN